MPETACKQKFATQATCEPVAVCTRAASSARTASPVRSRTCGRLYAGDAVLERLAQDLEDLAAELGQFIQEVHAVVGQRHLARPRHVAPADQPGVRDGMVGGAERAGW
jgi:hypothetical protein